MKTPPLGQHFLTSTAIAEAIVAASNVSGEDIVLEVGPGKGMLTGVLLKKAKKVVAVEKDVRMIAHLEQAFTKEIASGKLTLVHADILKFNPQHYNLQPTRLRPASGQATYKLIGNIPYYITGHFIRYFLSHKIQPARMTLLIQKEVALRIAREKKESILSISVKAYGTPRYVKTVKAGSFHPKPKVDSAILSIENISRDFFKDISEKSFFHAVTSGFSHKRKLLLRNLEVYASKRLLQKSFQACNIPLSARAEDIPLHTWKCFILHMRS